MMVDSASEILAETTRLLDQLFERNPIEPDDVISVLFTATADLRAVAPAAAARAYGLTDVPLICTQEMEVDGALGRCVRLLMHVETTVARRELRHVFLNEAVALRPDLADSDR